MGFSVQRGGDGDGRLNRDRLTGPHANYATGPLWGRSFCRLVGVRPSERSGRGARLRQLPALHARVETGMASPSLGEP